MAHWFLRVVSGARQGTSVPLQPDASLVIGRARGDLRLDDPLVSSAHCRVVCRGGRYILQDLGSTNGTLVDGRAVQDTVLRPGSEVVVGDTHLMVFDADAMEHSEGPGDAVAWLLNEEKRAADAIDAPSLDPALCAISGLSLGLKVLAGQDRATTFPLTHAHSVLGRSQGEVPLSDAEVSRQHVAIETFGHGMVFIRDLGSTNGSYHNGRRVHVAQFAVGDTLGCGKSVMRLVNTGV